jgi:uncharacterized coiled-coil DUF342 family protein
MTPDPLTFPTCGCVAPSACCHDLQASVRALRDAQEEIADLLQQGSEWEGLALERWQEIERLRQELDEAHALIEQMRKDVHA